MTPVPAAVIVPLIVLPLGAVAVTPAVKVVVPTNANVPVFEKVAALVIVPPALIATLYPAAAVLSVVAVSAPLNVIVPVVAVSVTVAAFTVLLNVVPADLVIVSVPNAVPLPTAPVTLMVPEVNPVSSVKFLALLLLIEEPNEMLPFDVVVSVVLLPKVTAPV